MTYKVRLSSKWKFTTPSAWKSKMFKRLLCRRTMSAWILLSMEVAVFSFSPIEFLFSAVFEGGIRAYVFSWNAGYQLISKPSSGYMLWRRRLFVLCCVTFLAFKYDEDNHVWKPFGVQLFVLIVFMYRCIYLPCLAIATLLSATVAPVFALAISFYVCVSLSLSHRRRPLEEEGEKRKK